MLEKPDIKETEKSEKPDKKNIDKIKDLIKEAFNEIFATSIIPSGYVRCKKCGKIILDSKDCPYCDKDKDNDKDNDKDIDFFFSEE